MPLPGGSGDAVLLLMPAHDEWLAITKLVTVHPQNSGRGLPVVQGDVLVMDAATGERLALLDGTVVTARRTAALSLLAARLLAPDSKGPLLVVGSGAQARSHLEAMHEGLGISQVYITSKNMEHAEALARYGQELGMDTNAVSRPDEVLSHVTLIVTATTSTTPVLPPTVREDAFVAAVGAYTPSMAELSPALVRRARLFVDTLEGAQAEAGDLIQAGVDWSQVSPLEQALDIERPVSGPVVFKSVGHALWDLAAARLAVSSL
jgi:ornithine cyclodeaminase